MSILVIGESSAITRENSGHTAFSAHTLARGGIPVPYSLVLTNNIFEEFIVETDIVQLLFSLIKKGKYDKAAALVQSTPFPSGLEHQILRSLENHSIKEFDVHSSPPSARHHYTCYKQRRNNLFAAIKSCWASAIQSEQGAISSVMITKHISTKKYGTLYSHHPLNNSPAHCVIVVDKPKKGIFYVQKDNGKLANPKDFHNLDSPLLVEEKNSLLILAQQLHSISHDPIIVNWALGDGAYALSFRPIDHDDRAHFLSQSTSS